MYLDIVEQKLIENLLVSSTDSISTVEILSRHLLRPISPAGDHVGLDEDLAFRADVGDHPGEIRSPRLLWRRCDLRKQPPGSSGSDDLDRGFNRLRVLVLLAEIEWSEIGQGRGGAEAVDLEGGDGAGGG